MVNKKYKVAIVSPSTIFKGNKINTFKQLNSLQFTMVTKPIKKMFEDAYSTLVLILLFPLLAFVFYYFAKDKMENYY